MRTALKPLALVLILVLAGCSQSQVITDINLAITTIEVAVPVVSVFGGPAAQIVKDQLQEGIVGLREVLTVAEAPGATSATIAVAIGQALTNIIQPNLPPGTPQLVVAVVSAAFGAIGILVARYGPQAPQGAAAIAAVPPVPMKLTMGDRRMIGKWHGRLDAASKALAK